MKPTVRCSCCKGTGKRPISRMDEQTLKAFTPAATCSIATQRMLQWGLLKPRTKKAEKLNPHDTRINKRAARLEKKGLLARSGKLSPPNGSDHRERAWVFEVV